MARIASAVVLSENDREQLQRWVGAQFTPQQVVLRSRIVLMAGEGKQDLEIASELDINRHTSSLWRKRFEADGLEAIWEIGPGRGRKPFYDEAKIAAIVRATLQSKPKGSTHWSCRTMARAQNVSKNTVNRIWQEYNLKPHRTDSFKLSRDINFLEKLTDVVGLYLNPPEKGLVLCMDEKSQIQALDRTQPGLPLKKGRCGTYTHDYVRHGTTTLFAALEILEGKVIGQCFARHRHQEFLKFLRRLEMHFIPTSSSWLNQVERWFGELTQKAVRRGAFVSVADLEEAIEQFLQAWNEQPRPFVWTATVETSWRK